MASATIRRYKLCDKENLLHILSLNVPDFFDKSEVEDLANYLYNEIEDYFVLDFNNKVIGAGGINYDQNNTVAYISWDFIHPELQGKGFGNQLMTHRINTIKNISTIKHIIVRTSQFAYRFYEKNGFLLTEIQEDYWAKGYDMYHMHYAH